MLRLFLPLLGLWATVGLRAEAVTGTTAEQMAARVANYQARLQLTAEQKQQLNPLFEENLTWFRDWHTRLQATESRWDRRGLLREARKHQTEAEKKIEPLLTETQRKAWQEIRDERRAELKAAYQHRTGN